MIIDKIYKFHIIIQSSLTHSLYKKYFDMPISNNEHILSHVITKQLSEVLQREVSDMLISSDMIIKFSLFDELKSNIYSHNESLVALTRLQYKNRLQYIQEKT